MQICVLGATGFIGGHIARAAQAQGWQVRAARRTANATGAIADVPVEWVSADLGDRAALREAMRGCDILFHAAATYPQDFRHIAAEVQRAKTEIEHVLHAAREANVRRVIYTSSLTTIGPSGDESTSYTPGSVRSAYYEAKFAMEQLVLQAAQHMDMVMLLPTAVFGPGDVKPTTGIIIREAAQGRVPVYFDATINAVDARDVAQAHVAAVSHAQRGQRYIIGGHNITLYDFLSVIAQCAGRKPPRIKLSRRLLKGLVQMADALPMINLPENFRTFEHWQPINDAKARRELGHISRALEVTVRDTLAWFGRA